MEASNAALAAEVAKFVRDKHMLEEEIRARRARYTSLFGRPTNFDSTGQRKGVTGNCRMYLHSLGEYGHDNRQSLALRLHVEVVHIVREGVMAFTPSRPMFSPRLLDGRAMKS